MKFHYEMTGRINSKNYANIVELHSFWQYVKVATATVGVNTGLCLLLRAIAQEEIRKCERA